MLRLWLGGDIADRILKSFRPNAEMRSDITEGVTLRNGRADSFGVPPIRWSTKHGVRIGLILLGILVFVSLLVLVRVLWAI